MRTGIDHPVYFQTKSFYNYPEGHYCPECHRENELRLVMAAMDNYALKHGETKLAKIFLKD